MDKFIEILVKVLDIILIVNGILVMYHFIISFAGIARFRKSGKHEAKNKFALIIAAHNEEVVIENLLNSIDRLDYPKHLYTTIVIADNCSDKTAEKARKKGVTVLERFNEELKGKGYAIEWGLLELKNKEVEYDAICVFDADNLVSKNFLKHMNNKLCEGNVAIQGYVDCKNPEENAITLAYSLSYWLTNRIFHLARYNIGISDQLCGTGFCLSKKLLDEIGWNANCLVEDLELSCKIILSGNKVVWDHDARVYDEKPTKLVSSFRQRKRWMQGFSDVNRRMFLDLIKRAFTKRDISSLDAAIYTLQPYVIVIAGIPNIYNIIVKTINMIDIKTYIEGIFTMIQNAGITGIMIVIFTIAYFPVLIFRDQKLTFRRVLNYYLIVPLYTLTWLPISIAGIIDRNKKQWIHTVHRSNVDIKEFELEESKSA